MFPAIEMQDMPSSYGISTATHIANEYVTPSETGSAVGTTAEKIKEAVNNLLEIQGNTPSGTNKDEEKFGKVDLFKSLNNIVDAFTNDAVVVITRRSRWEKQLNGAKSTAEFAGLLSNIGQVRASKRIKDLRLLLEEERAPTLQIGALKTLTQLLKQDPFEVEPRIGAIDGAISADWRFPDERFLTIRFHQAENSVSFVGVRKDLDAKVDVDRFSGRNKSLDDAISIFKAHGFAPAYERA